MVDRRRKAFSAWAFFLCLFFILEGGWIYSETITLTYSNTLETALRNNPDFLQSEKDYQIAKAQLGESYADLAIPQVSLSGRTGVDSSGSVITNEFRNGNTYNLLIITNFSDTYSASVGVSKTLFNGFQNWNAVETKKKNLAFYEKKLDDTKRTVKLNATVNFYNLLLLAETMKNQESASSNFLEQYRFNEASYNKGLITEIPYLQSKLNYNIAEANRIKSVHNYEQGKTVLLNFLGLKTNDIVLNASFMEITNTELTLFSGDTLVSAALSNDINYANIVYNIEAARISKNTEEMSRYPTVTGNASYGYSYQRDQNTVNGRTWQPVWTAGLNLTMPLDSFLPVSKTTKTLDEMEQNLSKLQISLAAQEDTTAAQVQTLLMQMEDNRNIMYNQRDNFELSRKSLELVMAGIKLGKNNQLDQISAAAALQQATSDYYLAVYNYYNSLWQLARLTDENY